jgi:hypothetical protein
MATTVQQLIDNALIPKPRERSGKYSPSKFGACFRAQYWNRKNFPASNLPDARTLRVFKAGQLFETWVKNVLITENGEWHDCGAEPIECEDVLGYADLIRDNEVADVKSQHSKSFWYMAKFKNDDIKKEKYHNWLQVMYYARELKKPFGRLIFISKDDLCIQEYVQPLDDYWLDELSTELRTLRNLWREDKLPAAEPRLFKKKDGTYSECDYCNFRDTCFEEQGKQLKLTKENENAES